MPDFTEATPCLRTWINMIDICLFWFENANTFMGLKYERGNKFTKNKLQKSGNVSADVLLKNYVTHMRLLKDIFALALGCMGGPNGRIGSGITKIVKECKLAVSPLKKLLMYQIELDNQQIRFNYKSDYKNPFIRHSNSKYVESIAWTNLINFENDIIPKLSKAGKQARKIYCNLDLIIPDIFVINERNNDLPNIKKSMITALRSKQLQIAKISAISTFYRTWNDSVIKETDTVWTRHANNDNLYRIKAFYKIKGLQQFANQYNLQLNNNFQPKYNCIIIALCDQWKLKTQHSHQFDYKKYSIHDTPSIFLTNAKTTINVEWIVQQCYIAHDHIIPCKSDQIGLQRSINLWPIDEHCHFPHIRNNPVQFEPNELPYCGTGWICNIHKRFNCEECLHNRLQNNGSIIYDCKEDKWPYYKAFTIYQGYIPRLFNARTINELGW